MIADIIARDAIGIFFNPSDEDADENAPYKSPSKLGSIEYLLSLINKTNFLEREG